MSVSVLYSPQRTTAPIAFEHWQGALEVRLAVSEAEVRAAQALRYQVFYEERGAMPCARRAALERDFDDFDVVCDHLLVFDHGDDGARVVGTYRLLRQEVAMANGGFYSGREYDLGALITHSEGGRQLLELGRSCVAPAWRNSGTISLLWRGIASYLQAHDIGHLFGCASLPGAEPLLHAAELSYLYHYHLAPPELRARSWADNYVDMNSVGAERIDARAARGLPALIKGYLRAGAMVGDGGFLDQQFNSVDVFVVMPVERITSRYAERFGG